MSFGPASALADNAAQLIVLGLTISAAHAIVCVVGSQLNPVPYANSMGKVPDQRVAVGYAVLFPVSLIVKVLVAQLMVGYF